MRNLIDIMIACYGVRLLPSESGEITAVDFDQLRGLNYRLNVDIGSSAQYSEIAQMNTLNNLFSNGAIDLETFLEVIPDKYLFGKDVIKEYVERQKEAQQQLAQMDQTVNIQ